MQSFEKNRKGVPKKVFWHRFCISCGYNVRVLLQQVSESRMPWIIVHLKAEFREFFGRRTTVLVTVKNDPDTGFRQCFHLIIYLNYTSVIGRVGDVESHDMQVLRGHSLATD